MKDYTDFIADAHNWQQNRPRFYLEELLPNSNSDYGIVAGRTGRGKTALLLHLACCFATGTPFFDLQVERIPVGYLGFEGNPINIAERLEKILKEFPPPEQGYLNLHIAEERYTLKDNVEKLREEAANLNLLLIDRAKGLVYGDYIKPAVANRFVSDLRTVMQDLNIATIISLQVRKQHAETKVKVGDLDSIKGALDYCEDATFVILLEQPSMKNPPDTWSNLYFAKHREASRELPHLELKYNYSKAMFVKR